MGTAAEDRSEPLLLLRAEETETCEAKKGLPCEGDWQREGLYIPCKECWVSVEEGRRLGSCRKGANGETDIIFGWYKSGCIA